jgi:UDP-N-acetylglucosamine diphosphorylase / glucose-1-phosphate thymidylyltransferase / UDP-N-acetylgalactosamine diphosphorylase / glucosamine-1-phosphate N-acetyltransferase / galactosamine-1-phosphate N-acetyltransferase
MAIYFYDDARARTFEPFALTRPVCELRAGAVLLRHRWESALGERGAGLLVAPHLEYF